jgi:hypothetical protein
MEKVEIVLIEDNAGRLRWIMDGRYWDVTDVPDPGIALRDLYCFVHDDLDNWTVPTGDALPEGDWPETDKVILSYGHYLTINRPSGMGAAGRRYVYGWPY